MLSLLGSIGLGLVQEALRRLERSFANSMYLVHGALVEASIACDVGTSEVSRWLQDGTFHIGK